MKGILSQTNCVVQVWSVLYTNFSGNHADSEDGMGGGMSVMNRVNLTIGSALFAGNFAAVSGGGVHIKVSSTD